MTDRCIRLLNKGIYSGSIVFENFVCGISVETPASYPENGLDVVGIRVLKSDGSYAIDNPRAAQAGSVSWSFVGDSDTRNPQYSYGDCNSCKSTSTFYDCINGQCIAKTQHNTPGLYQSLEDCQAVCANGGACGSGKQCVDPTTFIPSGKVCIDQGEFASIEALISKIGSEVC